jgi:hypothetical protein
MKSLFRDYWIVLVLFAPLACASVETVKEGRGNGAKRVYSGGCEIHWKKSVNAVRNLGLEILDLDKTRLEIIAKTSASAFSWGERVGVWLYPSQDGKACKVEVYSRRVGALNATGENWEPKFFNIYDQDE